MDTVYNKDSGWGTLKGVRPSKLYRKIFSALGDDYLSRKILREFYLISDEKISILEEVYANQSETIGKNYPVIHYVSMPFCPSKCSYCTFTTGVGSEYRGAYVDALLRELELSKELFTEAKIMYIGGGTPTYLDDGDFERVLKKVASLADYDEFTVEAGRPDTISEEKLDIMMAYGVDRISINPQTFNQSTLYGVNRKHSVEEIYKVYDLAVKKGFKDINMDIILGLPNEDLESVRFTVKELLRLEPSSITAHCLAIKRNNHLSENYLEEHIKRNEEIRQMMALVSESFSEADYEKYYIYRQKNIGGNGENIGYCKKGYESVYNILMMEDLTDVYGFGAGAISKKCEGHKVARLACPKNVKDYMARVDEMVEKRKAMEV